MYLFIPDIALIDTHPERYAPGDHVSLSRHEFRLRQERAGRGGGRVGEGSSLRRRALRDFSGWPGPAGLATPDASRAWPIYPPPQTSRDIKDVQ